MARTGAPVHLFSAACPGFVEFVERGQTVGDEVMVLAERLLAPICDADIDALLLGCTHYPFLARTISDVMGAGRHARELRRRDGVRGPVTAGRARPACVRRRSPSGRHRFLSSGDIESFRELGARLLGPELDHTERWPVARSPSRASPGGSSIEITP